MLREPGLTGIVRDGSDAAMSPSPPATGGRAPKRRHSLPAESDRQQAMDDPKLELQECGVSDPKEAQRAWLERFGDRIEAVP